MGLEASTYINGLVITNPTGTDGKSQGDDHLRLIKSTLKNTFPNITGAVTVTQAQLNAVGVAGVLNFAGMVTGFTGTQAQIPAGWQLCNGVGSTALGPVPDLRGRFIMASTGDAGTNPSKSTGGATTHSHTITVAGHALTIAQMPAHTHSNVGYNQYIGGVQYPGFDGSGDGFTGVPSASTGGGAAHNHGATASTASNLPPYYALAFIVKL